MSGHDMGTMVLALHESGDPIFILTEACIPNQNGLTEGKKATVEAN